MTPSNSILEAIGDDRARSVLLDLHARADREGPGRLWRLLGQIPRLVVGRTVPWAALSNLFRDQYLCIDRSQGVLCYLLARAIGARSIVELGTSFGISTIYLALAVRDNGGGRVIGTELVSSKAERAREHLHQAGLLDLVEIREGDATETLRELPESVDMVLCDVFPPVMLPGLRLVAPRMRRGAVVVSDNVNAVWGDHRDFLAWLHDPVNGFRSAMFPVNGGTELSIKVA